MHAERWHRHNCQAAARECDGEQRSPKDGADDACPNPIVANRRASDRDAPEIDPVAEAMQHGRQDRQRADHGREDDDHRPEADRREERVPGDEHACHCDEDRRSRDQHGLSGGSSRVLQRLVCRAAALPLFARSLEIEERIVDPDRHPDHEDDRADRLLVGRHNVADERVQTRRREHRGEREDDRQPGGYEGAECDHENYKRQRQ